MQLFLIRHAVAMEREAFDGEDCDRPLTDDGQARFERVVGGLSGLDVRFDLVLHSPWRRARETAALLAPIRLGSLQAAAELADTPTPGAVDALMDRCGAHERVACVGHEPFLNELLAMLISERPAALRPFRWKKGGVAWLEAAAPARDAFELVAFLPPAVLRRRGR